MIISDIMLPGINGLEFLIKCRGRDPGQTVIIMTAYDNLWTSDEALALGAYAYITKPLMHDEIKENRQKCAQPEKSASVHKSI